ncbi:hypothetical protein GCM10022419_113320 [Nonomuraea rosea]|uniref:Leucine-rich repeat domain-containing protein n=1 Tax=Nonomuraea rosea TaxID=638574 RepID=A0ABP6ZH55_9ACTN
MTDDEHRSHYNLYDQGYAGLPVAQAPWDEAAGPRPEAGAVAWRFTASEWDEDSPGRISECFDWFFERVDTAKVTAMVIGEWEECCSGDNAETVGRLAANAGRLPELRSLFLGAISPEQSEISRIQQSDITPLLEAFPKLERLEVRGGTGLGLRPVRHESLRVLRMETGGLPGTVVRGVSGSELPALERLELWFGVGEHGGDATAADCAGLLSGAGLPRLRHLGLQNSEIADELAAAVSTAPVVARLETLSLSMGALSDAGGEALLSGRPLTHLRRLDLSHHFLSSAMIARVKAALPGVEVVLFETGDLNRNRRYVAVSE